MRTLLLAATALIPLAAHAATYTIVAPGTTPGAGQYASMSALASAQKNTPFLQPGDTVDVQAGVYVADEGQFWNIGTPANPVTFMATGGIVYMPSLSGASNGKGTLNFVSSDVVVNGFVFGGNPSGSADNEAGIRMDVEYGTVDANGLPYPYNLTVENSGFLMKNMGVLADDCSTSHTLSGQYGETAGGIAYTNAPCSVTINNSYFSGDGNGTGTSHPIYLDRIDHITVTNNLIMGGFDGHLVKSRAFNSDIENNRIIEGPFAVGNSLIDLPVGGNATIKNNVMEIGPNNYNGVINYNEEAYPPILNNVGATVVITGNTVIDDYASANPTQSPLPLWWDDSLDTGKTAPLAHIPAGSSVALTMTGNTIYSPKMTASTVIASGNTNQGGWGAAPNHPAADPSNTFPAYSGAPKPSTTPPIAWPIPGTANETLDVTANGLSIPSNQVPPFTYYNPELLLWWNGLPLAPSATITATQATGATQTLTYSVPVIPGSLQFLGGQSLVNQCCLFGFVPLTATAGSTTISVAFPDFGVPTGGIFTIGYNATAIGGITIPAGYQATITDVDANDFTFQAPSPATANGTTSTQVYTSGANAVGVVLNWLQGSIGGGPTYALSGGAPGLGGIVGGTNTATFPVAGTAPPPPPVGPTLATPATLTLTAGTSAALTLSATDPDNTAAQLTYRLTKGVPAGAGVIRDNGVAAHSWTQADVNAGLVVYTADGVNAASYSISFTVSDPAGNSVAGTLPIVVTGIPRTYQVAPGVMLIPNSDGTWGWK